MKLHDALRNAIIESGMSYYRLAKESGVDSVCISRFMAGERDLRLETASRLATALNLELTDRSIIESAIDEADAKEALGV